MPECRSSTKTTRPEAGTRSQGTCQTSARGKAGGKAGSTAETGQTADAGCTQSATRQDPSRPCTRKPGRTPERAGRFEPWADEPARSTVPRQGKYRAQPAPDQRRQDRAFDKWQRDSNKTQRAPQRRP